MAICNNKYKKNIDRIESKASWHVEDFCLLELILVYMSNMSITDIDTKVVINLQTNYRVSTV